MENEIKFACIEVLQPIGTFYIGAMDYKNLIDISYVDVRRLKGSEREVEAYMGIQRPLSPNRVKEIGKYVNLVDAAFPTSVILAVSSKDAKYDKENHIMTLSSGGSVAKVLDGQHRIAGLESCTYPGDKFQINVVLFIDMELEDQAIVFATINKSHTKVNKSLVADLFDFAQDRSPQKSAHNIVRALNEKKGSPFEGKIKVLGTADEKNKETITQATFVDSLLDGITSDPMTDRDLYKRGRKPEKVTGREAEKLFFRNMFIDERDAEITQIVSNYFSAVRSKWPEAWNNVVPEMILNRSTGFIALMRLLRDVYLSFDKPEQVVTKNDFINLFERVDLEDADFTKTNYLPGSTGQKKLYDDLKMRIGLG